MALALLALPAMASALQSSVPLMSVASMRQVDAEELDGILVRDKRSADNTAAEVSPMTTAFHLNNSYLSLMVNWVGKDSPIVFVLGRDPKMEAGASSKVTVTDTTLFSY